MIFFRTPKQCFGVLFGGPPAINDRETLFGPTPFWGVPQKGGPKSEVFWVFSLIFRPALVRDLSPGHVPEPASFEGSETLKIGGIPLGV